MATVNEERIRAKPGVANRLLVRLLGSGLSRFVDGRLCVLRYRSAGSANPVTFPVQYARSGDQVVVVAANPERKRWWRHFRTGADAEVLLDGHWRPAEGRLLDGPARTTAAEDYARAFPRVTVPPETPVVVFTTAPRPRVPLRRRTLAWLWFFVVTIAEFVGFAIPATAGALTADRPVALTVPVMLLAGALEGAALGSGQAWVLRRAIPALNRGHWVTATAVAAAFAYLIGLAPSTWASSLTGWPPLLLWPTVAAMGIALLLSIGFAQWLVLRQHVAGSVFWIATTAGAWLLGLAVFLGVAMPLWQPGQAVSTIVLIGAFGGFLMAATTSAVTAVAVRRLPGLR
ncbi:hypothetical protein ACIA5G_25450 [Amycolatopsis sp. NPDC051758]|uniref:hypothetical protein n=1 Tax=Amycolatopsis sp. NPDC051758 TaxID=3363935 RepID=UPI00378A92ED